MIVWVFSGGGETELEGLIPFLNQHFPNLHFQRRTPVKKKPGPRPGRLNALGKTGKSLIEQMKQHLKRALQEKETCDLVMTFDDLDCLNQDKQTDLFTNALDTFTELSLKPRVIAFAAPEIDSWIAADWAESMGRHVHFRDHHVPISRKLGKYGLDFKAPETFSELNQAGDACKEKLSALLVQASDAFTGHHFSKAVHTPEMIQMVRPDVVRKKCPIFHHFFSQLETHQKTLEKKS